MFFLVSGFLITTTLLAGYTKQGELRIGNYVSRLAVRLFPMAYLVLAVTAAGSLVILPEIRHGQTVQEMTAAALYIENWQLALNQVDYLAQNLEASPVQHYWALSMQGQFYLLWPVVIMGGILLKRMSKDRFSLRRALLIVMGSVFVLSFLYSVWITSNLQAWAYFDTGARVWEFAAGGLLALLLPMIRLNRTVAWILGWIGLMMILAVGMLFPVERAFPGFAALFPIAGAALILIASDQGGRAGVGRIVGSRPLVWFGQYAYAFYLWHWPLLFFYLVRVRPEDVPLSDGLLLIGASVILAVATTEWLETPLRNLGKQRRPLVRTMVASVFVIPFVAVLLFWQLDMQSPAGEHSGETVITVPAGEDVTDNENHKEEEGSAFPYVVEDPRYPGAMGLFDEVPVPEAADIIPPAVDARESLPPVYDDGCHQNQTSEEVIACTYGYEGDDPAYTIAVVGGSHSAHWLPPLMAISEDEQILIRSYTKSNCRFTTDDLDELSEGCLPWGETLLELLTEDPPDLVFTTSTAKEGEEIPSGFLDKWASLNEHGIQVFAIRDVPWMAFDVAACVSEETDTNNCITPADEVLYAGDPWEDLQDQPSNVTYADLNPYICPDGECLPVIGNILVYRDSNHITKEYAISMRPLLEERIMPLLEGE